MSTATHIPGGVVRTWDALAAMLARLETATPGKVVLYLEHGQRRTIPEYLREAEHYRAPARERYVTTDGIDVYRTTDTDLAVWVDGTLPGVLALTLAVNNVVPLRQGDERAALVDLARLEGFTEKRPGVWQRVDKIALAVTFREGMAQATFCIRTGACLADAGTFTTEAWTWIQDRVAALPHAPIQRMKRQREAADPARSTAPETTVPEQGAQAIVIERPEPRQPESENPMPLDLSNPAVVAEARRVATNIKNAVGVPDIEARRADLRARNLVVEQAYRRADAEHGQALRALSEVRQALKDRAEELILVAAETKVEETRPRYGSDTAKKAALAAALKTDAAYQAIQTEVKTAEAALKKAPNDEKAAAETLLAQKKEALAAREADLAASVADEQVTEKVDRYKTADAKAAAAITLRKGDAEYLAIKAEVAKAEAALWQAEQASADAKAEQRALDREFTQLRADTDLATARVNAFAGLDVPAPQPAAAA